MHPQELDGRRQALAIAAAIACIAVVGMGLSLSIPLLSFAMEARGASATFIGLNTALSGVAIIMIAPFIPRLAARFGVRNLLLFALVLGAGTFVGFWYLKPLWTWFPLRFLFGLSLAILFVLSEFWINAAAPEARRGLVMGIYATVLSLGFAAGPTVLAIFDRSGPLPYFIGAGLFVVAALPIAMSAGLAPRLEQSPRHRILAYLKAAPSAVLAAFIFGAVETGGMSFLPLYGLRLGYDEVSAALLVSLLALGNVLVQIPLGLVSDRFDRRSMLLVLGVVGMLGAAVLPFVANRPEILFPLVAIWGGLIAGLYTVGLAHLGASFRGPELAGANATFVTLYSIGILAGPPIMGAGLDVWDPHGLPVTIVLLFLVYVTVVARRLYNARRRERAMRAAVRNP